MKRVLLIVLLLGLAATVVLGVVATQVPEARWRLKVVADMAMGDIDGVSWEQLISMLKPGSDIFLENLAETENIYSVVLNPRNNPEDVIAGAEIFRSNCVACHGVEGKGNSGPALATDEYKHGQSDWAMYQNIRNGIDGTNMLAMPLDDAEIWQSIAYIRSLSVSTVKAEIPKELDYSDVTTERLLNTRQEPGNWLHYSGHYDGTRYSSLDQVNRDNAHSLGIKWIRQFEGDELMIETTPIVNDGLMYVTEPPNNVHALDPKTGQTIWVYRHKLPNDTIVCCGRVNRGVAVYGDLLFMGTIDAKLIALNAKTGKLVWKTEVDDYTKGISITSAPLIADGKLIIGIGGGEFGIRGYLDAYNVETGDRLWRFHTVPGPGEPGHDTWAGESWKTGGAPTWMTGSYDPELKLLYWGVGNPGPLYQSHAREGDNLYSCSVIALNIETGELEWHFQFTPNDEHDWDSNQIPVLTDANWKGEERSLLLWPNRNAFYYVLDRKTGEFLLATPFAKQNWATGITPEGRPILDPATRVSVEGVLTYPSSTGAMNWQSPSLSNSTGYLYVPVVEFGSLMFKQEDVVEYVKGKQFYGSGQQFVSTDQTLYTAVRALNPLTGELIWERKSPPRTRWWKTGGVISTAGGIVFGGDYRRLFVLDDLSGEILWDLEVGGQINASPTTYLIDGQQQLMMAAGRSLFALGLPARSGAELANQTELAD